MWRAAQSLTACGVVCAALLVIGLASKIPQVAFHTGFILACALVSQILLQIFRHRQPAELASWIYLTNIFVSLAVVTLNHEYFVSARLPITIFIGVKIMAAIIALQTPMAKWVGWSSLTALAFVPVIQFFHWPTEVRASFGLTEPWVTLAVVICSGFIYSHRLNFFEVLMRKAKLEAKAAELRRFTHLLLGAQHLTNTPLQVIEGTTQLIRDQHPETAPLIEKIEKAFVPIQSISHLMTFGNSHILWDDVRLPSSVEELEVEVHLLAKELAQNQTLF